MFVHVCQKEEYVCFTGSVGFVLLEQAGMSWKYVSNDGVSIKLVILILLNFKVTSNSGFFLWGVVMFHFMLCLW